MPTMTSLEVEERADGHQIWRLHAVVGACLLFLVSGCGETLNECEALVLAECDIREVACQRHYHEVVRCVSGDDQPLPKIEVLTRQQFLLRYTEDPGPVATGDVVIIDRALVLLGLRVPVEGLGGVPSAYYDFERRAVVITDVDDTRGQLRTIARAHADTRRGGFLAEVLASSTTTDASLALSAAFVGEGIFHGDAAFYKTHAMADDAFIDHLRVNLYYGDEIADAARVARSPGFDLLFVGSAFHFGYGPDATLRAWFTDGDAGVQAAYDPGLTSTAQIIRSDYSPTDAASDATWPTLPAGLRYVGQDVFGPWLLHASQIRGLPPLEDAPITDDIAQIEATADAWRGDRVAVVHHEGLDQVAVVWQVEIDPNSEWAPQPLAVSPSPSSSRRSLAHVTLFVADTIELHDTVRAAFTGETDAAMQPRRFAFGAGGRGTGTPDQSMAKQ